MIGELWRHRYRPSIGTRAWVRCWGKRLRLVPDLLRQHRIQATLRRRGATIGDGCVIADHREITGKHRLLAIGDKSFLGRVTIAVHAQVTIGSNVCINDGTEILTASHDVASPNWESVDAPVVIEDNVWIAKRCLILPGVTIHTGAVVGAGAVVAKDVSPHAIVVGNPARKLPRQRCKTFDYSPVDQVALFRAWKSE